MKKKLDIENWHRKDQYKFFNTFDEPFIGVAVTVDCTEALNTSKQNNHSFFLHYLYLSLKAVNAIKPFKYRIIDNDVYIYDAINASPTINRADGTFGFSYMHYKPTFKEFEASAKLEIERVRNSKGLQPAVCGENVIHYSSIPWIQFTALSHARSFKFKDSCPKISFGKYFKKDNNILMPVSIHVHHALMDGYHVGQYIDLFQEFLNTEII